MSDIIFPTNKSVWPSTHDRVTDTSEYEILAAPGSNRCYYLTGITLTAGANTQIGLKDGTSGSLLLSMSVLANDTKQINLPHAIEMTANKALVVDSSAQPYDISVWGFEGSPMS